MYFFVFSCERKRCPCISPFQPPKSLISKEFISPDWQYGDVCCHVEKWFFLIAFQQMVCIALHTDTGSISKNTTIKCFLQLKKLSLTSIELLHKALSIFDRRELIRFHCLLSDLLSGGKWWYHVIFLVMIHNRNANSFFRYHCI